MSLNTRILLGTVVGILLGLAFSTLGLDAPASHYGLLTLGVVSTVFVGLLKMVMIPLVFTSIVVGVAQLQAHHRMRRVWLTSLLFFTLTTTLAVILGISAMHWFAPAADLKLEMFQSAITAHKASAGLTPSEFINHFIASLFVNPVQAMADGNLMGVLLFALLMGVALVAGGNRRVAVAAQIHHHHGEIARQSRRDAVPADMGLRKTVQQQQRRAGAADADVHRPGLGPDRMRDKAGEKIGSVGHGALPESE